VVDFTGVNDAGLAMFCGEGFQEDARAQTHDAARGYYSGLLWLSDSVTMPTAFEIWRIQLPGVSTLTVVPTASPAGSSFDKLTAIGAGAPAATDGMA